MIINDPDNWVLLTKTIKDRVKFNTDEYSKNFLMRRVEVRLRHTNINSYKEYANLLVSQDSEVDKLLKELTIHVTNFFRDLEFYKAFENEVIPILLTKKDVFVWSAGCSTGEEPYSLIICFLEKLKGKDFSFKILAQDYDFESIEHAKRGVYEEAQFKEMPADYKEKYFDKQGEVYVVKDFLKKYVVFEKGDILREKPKNVDLVVCRNTVIYFEAETKAKLYLDFYDILKESGFLILGKTETINGSAREKFKIFNGRERIYQK